MITDSLPDSADNDGKARATLWRAICVASGNVRTGFNVESIRGVDGAEIRAGVRVPDVPTWRLVEALSLLGVILRSQDATADVIQVPGKTGPIEIREDGVVRHLWSQQMLGGEVSSLGARPDLIVTSSPEPPHPGNAIRIIEAKCERNLDAVDVRKEFGKAYDLRVATYLIWSFYSPSSGLVGGAKRLGIDLEALGFDTDYRADLIEKPEVLISHVANAQEQARKAHRFERTLQETSEQVRRKLLGPPR